MGGGIRGRPPDVGSGGLRVGSRGLRPDECAAFLGGLDAGYLEVDKRRFVSSRCTRPKKAGGRHALSSQFSRMAARTRSRG